jgi:hypothetical protein
MERRLPKHFELLSSEKDYPLRQAALRRTIKDPSQEATIRLLKLVVDKPNDSFSNDIIDALTKQKSVHAERTAERFGLLPAPVRVRFALALSINEAADDHPLLVAARKDKDPHVRDCAAFIRTSAEEE